MLGDGLEMYPNPADEVLKLRFSGGAASINGKADAMIIDRQGKLLNQWQQDVKAGVAYEVDLSKLPAGVYFLKVISGESVFVKSFVKL